MTQYVFKEFGGAEEVRRFVYNMFEGALGAEEASSLADSVVADLLRNPGRRFDYRFFRGSFEVLAEAKTTGANFYHAVKEALQDAALARKPGKGQLFVWFIDPSIADEKGVKVLKSFLEENGIIVITDTESLRVLKTLDGAYRSRYGLDLVESVADWYGISKDAEVRAAFRRAVDSGEIYNFIPDWPREKQARLDLALQGFAEDSSSAVRLRDFVKRNWDLIAQVSGVAAKLAFDEWCRRNPPRSPEEAQLRQLVGRALDAYNVGVAALGEFRTALGFVRALKAAASGAGATALGAAVAAGVSLFTAAVFWYAQWWVESHTVYRLCASVGGRSVCFAIEKLASALASLLGVENLNFIVDGRVLASWGIQRGWLSQASLLDGSAAGSFGGVRVSCAHFIPPEFAKDFHARAAQMVSCTVEVDARESSARTASQPIGGCYLRKCGYEDVKVYVYSWRVRVDLLGLKEAQAPSRTLKTSYTVEKGCWIERVCAWEATPTSSAAPSGGYRPAPKPRYLPDVGW